MQEKVVMVSIVIPLYNEEDNVDSYEADFFPVIDKIAKEYNMTFDFIFVNDGSKDRTLERITAIAARRKDVRVLDHRKNQGMGATQNKVRTNRRRPHHHHGFRSHLQA